MSLTVLFHTDQFPRFSVHTPEHGHAPWCSQSRLLAPRVTLNSDGTFMPSRWNVQLGKVSMPSFPPTDFVPLAGHNAGLQPARRREKRIGAVVYQRLSMRIYIEVYPKDLSDSRIFLQDLASSRSDFYRLHFTSCAHLFSTTAAER